MRPPRAIVVAAVLVLGLYIIFGLRAARYEPQASGAFSWAAFHVHSNLSDGIGDLETIASAAREAGIDTVFLSEHGMPHRHAALVDQTIDGVRFVGGSEVGLPEGHVIVTAPRSVPDYKLPPDPVQAIEEIHAWDGIAVVTYPEDPKHGWAYWHDALRPDAIEIVNLTSYFRAAGVGRRLRWASQYIFQPLSYLSSVEPPAFALTKWDEMLARGPVAGIYSVNAHGGFEVTERSRIATPSYRDNFAMAALGFQRADAADPLGAFRRQAFFSILRGAGEPLHFDFSAEHDGRRYPMGSHLEQADHLEVRIDFEPYPHQIRLIRDGEVVATGEGTVRLDQPESGVYRVEVRLRSHPFLSEDVPWILSNPIYLRPSTYGQPRSLASSVACAGAIELPLADWRVEKDPDSRAELTRSDEHLVLDYRIAPATPAVPDRWVALAYRRELSLQAYDRVQIQAFGDRPMRYWLELRSGGDGFFRSVRIEPIAGTNPSANLAEISLNQTFAVFGSRQTSALTSADALFLTINSANSHTDFAASLTLQEVSLCPSASTP